jgi:hypothetical protein
MRFISWPTPMTRYSTKISYWFIRDIMLVFSGMSEGMSVHRKGAISLSHICWRQPQAPIVKTSLGSPKEIEDVFAKYS